MKKIKKEKRIGVRISPEEEEKLIQIKNATGLTTSDFFRLQLHKYKVRK